MLTAIALLLQVVGAYAQARGGDSAGIVRLIGFARAGALAGEAYKSAIESATIKVQQLVDENRGLTPQEAADLDASIESSFDRIAKADTSGDAPTDAAATS